MGVSQPSQPIPYKTRARERTRAYTRTRHIFIGKRVRRLRRLRQQEQFGDVRQQGVGVTVAVTMTGQRGAMEPAPPPPCAIYGAQGRAK